MSNHFHILLEVPRRPEVLPSDEELVALIRETHGPGVADNLVNWFRRWREQGNVEAIAAERERWFGQMWDVSRYMKVLKQRFSQWFNGSRAERRKGTLWEERFRSLLVESGEALQTVAAYIDLNPIRAGLVNDPKDYRWSGYGEACAGGRLATSGLLRAARASDSSRAVVSGEGEASAASFDLLAWYREQLYGRGAETHDAEGRVVRRGFSEEQIEKVRDARGRLPRHVFLHQRVRSFIDGALLGTQGFVESVFEVRRHWFSSTRACGSRRLQGLDLEDPLRTARALALGTQGVKPASGTSGGGIHGGP